MHVARILHWGGTKGISRGIPSPQPTKGSGQRRPQNTSGRENSVTLLNVVQSPESDMFV